MAGAGYKLFNTGDVLTAAQVNTYLQEQTVMVFANSTARTTALSGVLAEGMVSYLQDTNAVEVYNGSAWVGVSGAGDVTEVQAGTGISVASGTGPIPVVTNTMATAVDAKGDLIVGTGADTFARLAVGTNGYTLVADSSTATGLAYAAPSTPTWTSYTPTYTNVTVGNGTVVAEYAVSGDIVFIRYLLTFGSTTSVSGTIRISFPSGYNANEALNGIHFYGGLNGWVRANDNSVNNTVYAQPSIFSSTQWSINIMGSAGSYVDAQASLNATVPFTWATSDQLQAVFYYRKA